MEQEAAKDSGAEPAPGLRRRASGPRRKRASGRSGLEVVEEAFHLLRQAPARVLAFHAIGTVPFVLGFLYFWADLSRSAYAAGHAVVAALGVSVLFVWMKSWQAAFAAELRACVTGGAPPDWTWRRLARLAALQAAIQPYGLAGLPGALAMALPFPAVYAFFQNVTVLGDSGQAGLRDTVARAWRQAMLWQGQNHVLVWLVCPWLLGAGLLVGFGGVWLALALTPGLYVIDGGLWFLLGLVFVFNLILPLAPLGCVVAGNVAALLASWPMLWGALTGSQTVFALSGLHGLVNTTFLTTVFGITYLLLDPLAKAVYVLRCFHGESLATGEDLRTAFAGARPGPAGTGRLAAALLAAGLVLSATAVTAGEPGGPGRASSGPGAVQAGPPPAAQPVPVLTVEGLDAVIDDVFARPEYAWRMPRERAADDDAGTSLWGEFFRRLGEATLEALRDLAHFLRRIGRWLRRLFPERAAPEPGDLAWQTPVQTFLFVVLALSASILAVLVYRAWRKRRTPPRQVQAQPIVTAAALLRDEVTADQLPSDEWMALARDLLARGETRLALRAMFLGALAHLAHAGRLTVVRCKSNRDYRLELERKAHDLPELLAAFGQNVRLVERVWYGAHAATPEQVEAYAANQARLLALRPAPCGPGEGA